jgi:hypothetical protein
VTGNHSTSTGPISRAASRTPVLVFNTLVSGIMQLSFQTTLKNVMHKEIYINNIGCSVVK